MKLGELEKIKKLLEYGIDDLELISFELDIPLKTVKEYKLQIKKQQNQESKIEGENNRKKYSAQEMIDKERAKIHSTMRKIRERYYSLYLKNNNVDLMTDSKISEEDIKEADISIGIIDKEILELKKQSEIEEKNKSIKKIYQQLEKIKKCQISIEQAERLIQLLDVKQLQYIDLSKGLKKERVLLDVKQTANSIKGEMEIKLINAINMQIDEMQDIEDLEKLNKKITIEIIKSHPLIAGNAKDRLSRKIVRLKQSKNENQTLKIPERLEKIAKDLASGNLNIEEARNIIEEELGEIKERNPRAKIFMKEEQQRNQVIYYIEKALAEGKQIVDPEKTIEQMQEINGKQLDSAIRSVILNMIKRKEFKRARDLCSELKNKNKAMINFIRIQQGEIDREEISDIVFNALHCENIDEEVLCYKRIKRGLDEEYIKPELVSLGKSKDGLRNITLASIWLDEEEIDKHR